MIHENHLCRNCSAKQGDHAGPSNPHAAPGACPPGRFPRWPHTIRDEKRAGLLFDKRVAKFWQGSKTTFQPKV